MKIFHLSDLHIGKSVHEYSMKEEQIHILDEILSYIEEEHPQAVIFAGDIYDKSVPSIEAVNILDEFFTKISKTGAKILIISGNHDSSHRLNFASRLLESNNIYIESVFDGKVRVVTLDDEYGEVNFYMHPFIKPMDVRGYYEVRDIESYNDAIKAVIESTYVDKSKRNVMIAHQFVTGAIRTESEITVGTVDNVDGTIFDDYDYVALGHIHRPQKVLRETMRYSGTPLSYSFSEKDDKKSITVIDFDEGKVPKITFLPLLPLHRMVEVRGSLEELLTREEATDDYVKVILTDDVAIDAMAKLQKIYPNIMQIVFEDKKAIDMLDGIAGDNVLNKDKYELFSDFYKEITGEDMNEQDKAYLVRCMESGNGED